ncbi:MAG: hypothetical protein EOO20_11675 [Chryseobacterium sp.]|nr:MAG: hypothetical protein EOO20_11675 [Chryseobacterium sp.]
MNGNKIVNSLWISDSIGLIQKICYNSYYEKKHLVHLYSYGTIDNLPSHVILKDANKIIPEKMIFKDFRNSYATFSDWFRIKLLYDLGGWWVDSDTVCIRPFVIDDEYVFATEVVDASGKVEICNAVIKMPKHSGIGNAILRDIETTLEKKTHNSIFWTEIGAQLISANINEFGLTDFITAPEVFCPINYFDFKSFFSDDNFEISSETYGVHLWNKMWEWDEIDPSKSFSKQTFFENLKSKYDL